MKIPSRNFVKLLWPPQPTNRNAMNDANGTTNKTMPAVTIRRRRRRSLSSASMASRARRAGYTGDVAACQQKEVTCFLILMFMIMSPVCLSSETAATTAETTTTPIHNSTITKTITTQPNSVRKRGRPKQDIATNRQHKTNNGYYREVHSMGYVVDDDGRRRRRLQRQQDVGTTSATSTKNVHCIICPNSNIATGLDGISGMQCRQADVLGRDKLLDFETCSVFQLLALRDDDPCGCFPPAATTMSAPTNQGPTPATVIPPQQPQITTTAVPAAAAAAVSEETQAASILPSSSSVDALFISVEDTTGVSSIPSGSEASSSSNSRFIGDDDARFPCNICRSGGILTNLNALLFGFGGGLMGFGITCGDAQEIGGPFGPGYTLKQCAIAQALAIDTCGCPGDVDDPNNLLSAVDTTKKVFCSVCFEGKATFETATIGGVQCGELDVRARKFEFTQPECLQIQTAAAASLDDVCRCHDPSASPTLYPSPSPSMTPSLSSEPSFVPSLSLEPSQVPSSVPSVSSSPSLVPSQVPSESFKPSFVPSLSPSISLEPSVSSQPSISSEPSVSLHPSVSLEPSVSLQPSVSSQPSMGPSRSPSTSMVPSLMPSSSPSITPTPLVCGSTYNTPGIVYTVAMDIDPCATTIFQGTDFVLDCNGNTLTTTNTDVSLFILEGGGTIRNCVIDIVQLSGDVISITDAQMTSSNTYSIENVFIMVSMMTSNNGIGIEPATMTPVDVLISNSEFSNLDASGIFASADSFEMITLTTQNVVTNTNGENGISVNTGLGNGVISLNLNGHTSNGNVDQGLDVVGGNIDTTISTGVFCNSVSGTDISFSIQQATDSFTNVMCGLSSPNPGSPMICQSNMCPLP